MTTYRTPTTEQLFHFIQKKPGISHIELAERVRCSAEELVTIMNRLIKKGSVCRQADGYIMSIDAQNRKIANEAFNVVMNSDHYADLMREGGAA